MVTFFIGSVLLLEIILAAGILVFAQQYGPVIQFLSFLPLILIVGKGAFTASLLRPSMWYVWGNLSLICISISLYDRMIVHSDISLITVINHCLLWSASLACAWLCRVSMR